eukprot:362932-Chlamydomonas_euryale.AAC.11
MRWASLLIVLAVHECCHERSIPFLSPSVPSFSTEPMPRSSGLGNYNPSWAALSLSDAMRLTFDAIHLTSDAMRLTSDATRSTSEAMRLTSDAMRSTSDAVRLTCHVRRSSRARKAC